MDVFPPAPTAASLGKFGKTPVGYYTGVPRVEIPLWEVREGNIKVPVKLTYHAGGVQVQEVASWVGIGFALKAGGVISRNTRGIPDDLLHGYLDPTISLPTSYDVNNEQSFLDYADGIHDSQPDLFTFNFGERTGTFVIDQNWNIRMAPFQKIKIVPSHPNGYISSWTITTEDGFVYTFDVQEMAKHNTQCTQSMSSSDPDYYTSSWFLSSVTSPSGSKVTFEYSPSYSLNYNVSIFEHNYQLLQIDDNFPSTKQNLNCTSSQDARFATRLSRIVFNSGSIEFKAQTPRGDLIGDKSLDTVIIKNDRGQVVRYFLFGYQYMAINSQPVSLTLPYNASSSDNYRLILTSLQEADATGATSKPAYQFYYDCGLPNRLSYSVDFWGYCNGKSTNITLVPEDVNDGKAYNGASRLPDINFATKGTLNKIIYPTGGSTTFTYELHKADMGIKDYILRTAVLQPLTTTQTINNQTTVCIQNQDYSIPFAVNCIGTTGTIVEVDISNFPCLSNSCDLNVSIYKVNPADGSLSTVPVFSTTNYLIATNNQPNIQAIWLDNGSYMIKCPPKSGCYKPFKLTVTWQDFTGKPEFTVGGLRVKRIEDYDPVTGKKFVRNYSYVDDNQATTGKGITMPQFGYSYSESTYDKILQKALYSHYFVRTSTSTIPPGMTYGSFVGYSQVTEYFGETINGTVTDIGIGGKTVYKYTDARMYPDKSIVSGYPFSPAESRDWQRGLLLEQTDYRRVGANYNPVKKTSNTYRFYDETNLTSNVGNCLGLKVAYYQKFLVEGLHGLYALNYFNFYTGYQELASTTETVYDQNDPSKLMSKTINYTYGVNHLQPVLTEKIQSDDSKVLQYIAYPLDFADVSGFIQDLNTSNIVSAPISKVVYKTENDGSNVRILSSEITTYKTGGQGLKDAVYFLKNVNTVPLTQFRFPNRSSTGILPPAGTASNLYIDPTVYEKRVSYDAYDSKGNIIQYTKDGSVTSVIWGYNNFLPIAGVENALRGTDMTVTSQIAYNGFEQGIAPGEAGWQNVSSTNIIDKTVDASYVFAGRYSYKMSPGTSTPFIGPTFYITPPVPQKGKYKLCAWVKTPSGYITNKATLNLYTFIKGSCCTASPSNPANNFSFSIPATNNAWQYFEAIIDFNTLRSFSGQSDLTIACSAKNGDVNVPVYIDEMRIYPLDAMMTTYTYDTQVGVTSEMSPNGTTKFYEYDGLGRLKNEKNQDGNITDSYTYFYGKLY